MAISNDDIIRLAFGVVPLAISVGHGCFSKSLRPVSKIRKHILLLPSSSGASTLCEKMNKTQTQYTFYDVSTEMRRFLKGLDLGRHDEIFEKGEHTMLTDEHYCETAEKLFQHVRTLHKTAKSRKAVFVSSCYEWARQHKLDSVFVAIPDRELLDKLLEDKNSEKREAIYKTRQSFVSSLPPPVFERATIYRSFDELEEMVRGYLGIRRLV